MLTINEFKSETKGASNEKNHRQCYSRYRVRHVLRA